MKKPEAVFQLFSTVVVDIHLPNDFQAGLNAGTNVDILYRISLKCRAVLHS